MKYCLDIHMPGLKSNVESDCRSVNICVLTVTVFDCCVVLLFYVHDKGDKGNDSIADRKGVPSKGRSYCSPRSTPMLLIDATVAAIDPTSTTG